MAELVFSNQAAAKRLEPGWVDRISVDEAAGVASRILVSLFEDLERSELLAGRVERLTDEAIEGTRSKLLSDFFGALGKTLRDLEWVETDKPSNLAGLLGEIDTETIRSEFRRRATAVAGRMVAVARERHPERFAEFLDELRWRAIEAAA